MNQRYEITIQGHLTTKWEAVFEGMKVFCLEDGNTRITGDGFDQSALYGLIDQLRDLGMTLISVKPVSTSIPGDPSVDMPRRVLK